MAAHTHRMAEGWPLAQARCSFFHVQRAGGAGRRSEAGMPANKSRRTARTLLAAAGGLGWLGAFAPAAPPTFTTIAITGQAAPGLGAGVNIATFPQEPSINAAGNIAFLATVSGTGVTDANDTAAWEGIPESAQLVVRKGAGATQE